jgi:hypothetical protein
MKLGSRKPLVVATAAATGVLAVAVGIAVSASASASSASPSASPSGLPSGGPGSRGGPGHMGGPGVGPGRGFGGPGGPGGFAGPGGFGARGQVLHGEEVVQHGTTYVTIDEQTGKVTAVTSTSITVKSSDGYTATYVVGSATRIGKKGAAAKVSDVAVGDTVRIEGTKSGGTVTADRVMDGLPPAGAWRGPGPGNGPGYGYGRGPGGTARPSPPAAPSGSA